MMPAAEPFPGTNEELFRLAEAAAHYCTCAMNEPVCTVHAMLMDEDITRHLVFVARQAVRLLAEEFQP